MSILTLILVLTSYSTCSGYKLLLVFPFPTLSHSALGEGYVRNLLKAGHEVTYITPYPIKNDAKELRQIEVMNNTKLFPDEITNIKNYLNKKTATADIRTGTFLDMMLKLANATVMHKNVQKLLNDGEQEFDAVIVEWMYSEIYAGFSSVFNCPLIWSSSMEPNALLLMLLNEHPNSFSPGLLASTSNLSLSFWQRVAEQFQFLYVKFQRWLLADKEKSVFNRAFGPATAKRGGILPCFEVIKYNGSLLLGNSHFSTGQTFRLPLNYIQIAGYHIDENKEPLSMNLQKIMDASKNGVIYFSTASTLRGNTVPNDVKIGLLDVFKEVNRTVIWQHEGQLKAPKNVQLFDRVPQQSILAHPNCVLFVTSGEYQSIIEAIHFGVPIIGMPIFIDQFKNVDKAVNKGFAKKVDILDIKALKAAIDDVLRNTNYRQKAKELSAIFRDRPISPDKELVFWVEHVVRTHGAVHLRSPMLLPWYDTVYSELMIAFMIPLACLCVLIAYLLRRKNEDDYLGFKKFI